MHRKASWFCWQLVAATVLWLSTISSLSAQITIPQAATKPTVEFDGVLRRAAQMEHEQRWGEAMALYEEALRENPGDARLSGRHELAKIHYDLGRRYHDSSFLESLSKLGQREAITLYSEVLSKIQSHYVNEPDWAHLVRCGTKSLDVALGEPVFIERANITTSHAQIDAVRRELVRQMQARPIANRQQAIDAVTAASQMLGQYLKMSSTVVILEYACGASMALDEYSAFLTGDQLNDVYAQIDGNFVGLGIELKAHEGSLLIEKVISGSPAERGGIRAADRIVAVDGRSTLELSTDQAADLLQGPEGSMVEVTVKSPNGREPRRLVLRREHVDVPSVDDVKIIDRERGIGYLKLTCFQKTTSRDLDTALWNLRRDGMRSLIVDVRRNPGGLLTASVEVVDKFVEDGVIVSTRGRNSMEDYNFTAHRANTWKMPLVVLIDGDSASASEIFAGAIRDHGRGAIIGQRSYGKGSVQGIFPLSVASAGVRLTTAKFYSPNGQAISRVGVKPTIEVRQVAKPVDGQVNPSEKDETLAAALIHLKVPGQTAQR